PVAPVIRMHLPARPSRINPPPLCDVSRLSRTGCRGPRPSPLYRPVDYRGCPTVANGHRPALIRLSRSSPSLFSDLLCANTHDYQWYTHKEDLPCEHPSASNEKAVPVGAYEARTLTPIRLAIERT